MNASAVLTLGLGPWGNVALILTLGYKFYEFEEPVGGVFGLVFSDDIWNSPWG